MVGRAINLCFLKTRIQYEGEDENLLKEDYTGPGPILAWYTQDGLGSVRQLVVGDTVQNGYAYTAWGVPLSWHERISNRYTFTSREYNPETHLYYYRGRYYEPFSSRFLTSDPAEKERIQFGRWGRQYHYVDNIPTKYKDPSGEQAMPGDIVPSPAEKMAYPGDREAQERAAAARVNMILGFGKRFSWKPLPPSLKTRYLFQLKRFFNQFKGKYCFAEVVSIGDIEKAKEALRQVSAIIVQRIPGERPGLYFPGVLLRGAGTIFINKDSLEQADGTTLWHELMHAIFYQKTALSIEEQERRTVFMEDMVGALKALTVLEDAARRVAPEQECPRETQNKIKRFWELFLKRMTQARLGKLGVNVYYNSTRWLTRKELQELKSFCGIDADPNKILMLYYGQIRVPAIQGWSCTCCGKTSLQRIIRQRRVDW